MADILMKYKPSKSTKELKDSFIELAIENMHLRRSKELLISDNCVLKEMICDLNAKINNLKKLESIEIQAKELANVLDSVKRVAGDSLVGDQYNIVNQVKALRVFFDENIDRKGNKK